MTVVNVLIFFFLYMKGFITDNVLLLLYIINSNMTEKSILQGTKINSTFLALYFLYFLRQLMIILSMLEYLKWNIVSKYIYIVYGKQVHSNNCQTLFYGW